MHFSAYFIMIVKKRKNKTMIKSYEQLKWEMEILDEFIEKAYEGLIIIDREGKIVKFKYERLLDIKEEDVIGKHVTDVIENTRLHIVLKTGTPEIGDIQKIKGHDVVTSRIPIIRSGEVVGAVGTILFKDVQEVKHLSDHLEKMKAHVKKVNKELKRLNLAKYSFEQILTADPQMVMLIHTAKMAAETNSSVYIEGASGTGKEYFAHAIHEASYRRYAPFIRINCASIPKDLFESELFGYEPGAFTGASTHGRIGKFELANGGTIFLDELSAMPLEMQVKLLRVIEEREIERIGGNQSIQLDVRIISASNENLYDLTATGQFRHDLYYRLNVVGLKLPPLKERQRDVALLTHHFLSQFAKDKPIEITKQALNALEAYSWPGNVRELRNVIESALALIQSNVLTIRELPENISLYGSAHGSKGYAFASDGLDLKVKLDQLERQMIEEALYQSGDCKTKAAQMLGIHRTALYKKMHKLGILS